ARDPRAGRPLPPTLPSTLSLSLTGRRRSRASSTRSRRRGASAPKKYASKPRKTAADRTAKFWFRNTTSALGEPPINAKNSASISARSIISVSRLFQTRAAPAPRRLQRSGSSLKRPGAAAQVRKYGPVNGPFRHRGQSTQPAVNFLRVSLEQWIVEEVDLADGERVVPVGSDNPIRPFQS